MRPSLLRKKALLRQLRHGGTAHAWACTAVCLLRVHIRDQLALTGSPCSTKSLEILARLEYVAQIYGKEAGTWFGSDLGPAIFCTILLNVLLNMLDIADGWGLAYRVIHYLPEKLIPTMENQLFL